MARHAAYVDRGRLDVFLIELFGGEPEPDFANWSIDTWRSRTEAAVLAAASSEGLWSRLAGVARRACPACNAVVEVGLFAPPFYSAAECACGASFLGRDTNALDVPAWVAKLLPLGGYMAYHLAAGKAGGRKLYR